MSPFLLIPGTTLVLQLLLAYGNSNQNWDIKKKIEVNVLDTSLQVPLLHITL
jgi:hypothetical protein